MHTLHPALVPLVKGVLFNPTDQGYWNALEDQCRDLELPYQVACLVYMAKLNQALAKPPIEITQSKLFDVVEGSPYIDSPIIKPKSHNVWNKSWFPTRPEITNHLLCRGAFPKNCHSIGRIFAAFGLCIDEHLKPKRDSQYAHIPCLRKSVSILAAMRLIDHQERNSWLNINIPPTYQIFRGINSFLWAARSGKFGYIQHLVFSRYQRYMQQLARPSTNHRLFNLPTMLADLLQLEHLVNATREWVAEQ